MSRILKNAQRLVTTPGMFSAYYKWVIARTLSSAGPAVACTSDTQVSGWLNFSEYWSFHQGIPKSEKFLMERCLNSASQERTVAIDIGANVGLFTVALASLRYSEVHAFEPVPQTFARLKANAANNQLLEKIRLNCMAVGAEEGFIEFQIFENSPAINRFVSFSSHKEPNILTATQNVTVTTLDKYCEEHQIDKVDFLKIDVEGMEPLVIQGANKLLQQKRISTILIEICPANLEIGGTSIHHLYESIVNVSYLPHLLLKSGDVGEVMTREELQKLTLANVVLIPNQD